MSHPLKFSVLISSYNYAKHVAQAVESALAQTLKPVEIIVVDDGSTDDSVALLEARFGNEARVQIISQSNTGQMSAWIAGFSRSSGDFIALLDSDDLWNANPMSTLSIATWSFLARAAV
jgi:glycosyltransferase involved in cell wall biosynthesis